MDFFNKTGKVAIGSRLRMLTAKITEDAVQLYQIYGTDLQPKWFPVFYILSESSEKSITEIAVDIGHSQPSVSKIIREMAKKDLIIQQKDQIDGRRNVVQLSEKGWAIAEKIKDQYVDVNKAIDGLLTQTTHNLWEAIDEWEFLLDQKSLLQRVNEQRKERESAHVTIVEYTPAHQSAFRELNIEWISAYFKLEAADYKALDNPETYILANGGIILVALYNDEPVGVCALLKMDDPMYDFELAKMAVLPNVQGKNIGYLLGKAIIERAKSAGAAVIYLESNTLLKPAINLYHKLGFKKIAGRTTAYERCNIQMELLLNEPSHARQ